MNEFLSLRNQRILVTGHTGFKGSWLCKFLEIIGSETFGYSLAPLTDSLYTKINPLDEAHQALGDINDYERFKNFVTDVNPTIIFHLAAQSLVIDSYEDPRQTFDTNVMGTINVIESALNVRSLVGVVAITTDKVYENNEVGMPFKESDPKGGHDPYSGSKAGMEMALNSWQYFYKKKNLKLVSARAGNVIGMGDRAKNRLLPDLISALKDNQDVHLRNPQSVRPWQHVLEPLMGYLQIAEKMIEKKELSDAYNFGPTAQSHKSVLEVANIAVSYWGNESKVNTLYDQNEILLPEAKLLMLDSSLAKKELNWESRLTAEQAIHLTLAGEKSISKNPVDEVMVQQIRDYIGMQ